MTLCPCCKLSILTRSKEHQYLKRQDTRTKDLVILVPCGKIIVSGDAAATAHNIVASPLLWRIGITGDLIMHLCDLFLTIIYYLLLKRVNKTLAMLSVLPG